jgi:hypothetical protein
MKHGDGFQIWHKDLSNTNTLAIIVVNLKMVERDKIFSTLAKEESPCEMSTSDDNDTTPAAEVVKVDKGISSEESFHDAKSSKEFVCCNWYTKGGVCNMLVGVIPICYQFALYQVEIHKHCYWLRRRTASPPSNEEESSCNHWYCRHHRPMRLFQYKKNSNMLDNDVFSSDENNNQNSGNQFSSDENNDVHVRWFYHPCKAAKVVMNSPLTNMDLLMLSLSIC